ncbi:uncharacterized protein [Dermacentor albipictus]|uniref:uncharacterized protein n=1 Tax=Dermacentor albipictus TaxID=60249 RepID=UPI0038FCFA86
MEMFMKTILYLCFLVLFQSTATSTTAKGTHELQRLGENVTVNAFVLYDKSILNETQAAMNDTRPVWDHFKKIFEQIQQAINKKGVNITMNVTNVTEGQNICVNSTSATFGLQLNGTATLENLLKYANSTGINETNYIFYFFVGTSFDVNITQTDELFTRDTFCTENKTAAVVKTIALPQFYLTALKMTLFALGSNHTQVLYREDKEKLQEVFQRCHHNSTESSQCLKK